MASESLQTDILIIGAGFAGAATAYHLSQSFKGSILIVEKEEIPGFHASGRNASLLLQSTDQAEIRRWAVASKSSYEQLRDVIDFRQTGSMILGPREQLQELRDPSLVASEFQEPQSVQNEIPALAGHEFESALFTPSDGVMDISRLLTYYIDGARASGAGLRLNCSVETIEKNSAFKIKTSSGEIRAGIVVNGAGAWAGQVARLAGAASVDLFPLKRHLFVLENVGRTHDRQPFVWNISKDFYFRPESGGVLFSVCDEEPTRSLEPTVNSEISEIVAEVIWKELPALQEAVQRRVWSCFRTKAIDEQFVIGWDRALDNFFWVAGLGGHGMGASWEVGRRAAQAILDRQGSSLPKIFNPGRRIPAAKLGPASKSQISTL